MMTPKKKKKAVKVAKKTGGALSSLLNNVASKSKDPYGEVMKKPVSSASIGKAMMGKVSKAKKKKDTSKRKY